MSAIGKLIGKITGADAATRAAEEAGRIQAGSAQQGIDEQRRQFDAMQAMLASYMQVGQGALTGQQNLIGLNGADAQGSAISGIQGSPMFTALQQQGENSILQNASATGGLRGGNTQAALAQFSPQLLAQLIEQQYGRLGQLSQMGQNSATGVGNAGLQTGMNVGNLLQQQGAALAGGTVARGSLARTGFSDLLKIGGTVAAAMGGMPGGGGGAGAGVVSGGSGMSVPAGFKF